MSDVLNFRVFCVQALGDKVISLTRLDKEVVLFYNSPEMALQVDEGETLKEMNMEKLVRWMDRPMNGWMDGQLVDFQKHLFQNILLLI